jgi:hypothetical protein
MAELKIAEAQLKICDHSQMLKDLANQPDRPPGTS